MEITVIAMPNENEIGAPLHRPGSFDSRIQHLGKYA
jgi:hypothetical protein